jgi:hypothetical protein
MEILNKTIDYSVLYEQLNKEYPDQKLHDFKMDHVKVVNMPKGNPVFTGKNQKIIGAEPDVVTFERVKFFDFDIGENVTISNDLFVAKRGIKDLLQVILKKLGKV